MLFQVLSVSSIILGIYLIMTFFLKKGIDVPYDYESDFHLGCFNEENQIEHSQNLQSFLTQIQIETSQYQIKSLNHSIATRIDFNKEAKEIARNFEGFLNEYYKVKSKSDFQENFYNSLQIARNQATECENSISQIFDEQACLNHWAAFNQSHEQYIKLKQGLIQKIQDKQSKQIKISNLFFNSDFQDQEEVQKNYSIRIKALEAEKQLIEDQVLNLTTKKLKLSGELNTNNDKLIQFKNKLNECETNKKIILFCNELSEDLKVLSVNVTKQDLQKKIHRKKQIIQAFGNALKKAKKLNDQNLIQYNQKYLKRNEDELKLLEVQIDAFKLYEEQYCFDCSEEKVKILKEDIALLEAQTNSLTLQYEYITKTLIDNNARIQSIKLSKDRLEEELEFQITSRVCISDQCKNQRAENISEYKQQLNELKKAVLDHQKQMVRYGSSHDLKIDRLRQYLPHLNSIKSCVQKREYYEKLKNFAPRHDENQLMKITEIKKKIIQRLNYFQSETLRQTKQIGHKEEDL